MVFEGLNAYIGEEPFIFLSYSHKDSAKVAGFVKELSQQAGYRVWYDEGLSPGSEWDEHIAAQILRSNYFFALISENYLDSRNCLDELKFALSKNTSILLIYLTRTELPDGLEMRASRYQALYMDEMYTWTSLCNKIGSAEGIEKCRTGEAPHFTTSDSSEPHDEKGSSSRKKWILPAVIVAVLLCVLLLIITGVIPLMSGKKSSVSSTEETASAQTYNSLAEILSGNAVFPLYGTLTDDDVNEFVVCGGTCFLINEDTVLTSYSAVNIDRVLAMLQDGTMSLEDTDLSNESYEALRQRISLSVKLDEDFFIDAELIGSNQKQDLAVLRLSQPRTDEKCLKLGKSDSISPSEKVYALSAQFIAGPVSAEVFEGNILDTQTHFVLGGYEDIDGIFLTTDCMINGGNGGSPLIDEDGYIIGIISSGNESCTYVSPVDFVIEELDRLHITYSSDQEEA